MDKRCTKCKETLPEESFAFSNRSKNIRKPACKKCSNAESSMWRKKNPDKAWVANLQAYGRARYKPCDCCSRQQLEGFLLKRPDGFHVDHIISRLEGGKHCVHNMQYLSPKEHREKTNKEISTRASN